MNNLLAFLADCWLPLLLAAAACLALYHLGRLRGRGDVRRNIKREWQHHRANSMFLRL